MVVPSVIPGLSLESLAVGTFWVEASWDVRRDDWLKPG